MDTVTWLTLVAPCEAATVSKFVTEQLVLIHTTLNDRTHQRASCFALNLRLADVSAERWQSETRRIKIPGGQWVAAKAYAESIEALPMPSTPSSCALI